MVREKGFFVVIIISVCFLLPGTWLLGEESLYSENIADIFIKQASEIHDQDPLDPVATQQATAFIQAAYALDPISVEIPRQTLRIAIADCFNPLTDQDNVRRAMGEYLKERSDIQLAIDTVGCILQQLNTRLDRQVELDKLARKYESQNPVFASELLTQMGFLAIEKANTSVAANVFLRASQLNPYNDLAFSHFLELAKTQNPSNASLMELQLFRTRLTVNPYDFDAAVAYANKLLNFQIYDIAARAYEYAARLFDLLYPDGRMSTEIAQSWALSCYHVEHSESKTLEIAEKYRSSDCFDLFLEAIVGKSLIKLGQAEKGKDLLEMTVQRAEALLQEESPSKRIYPEQLAWLYSVVLDEPEKALAWANQAFEQAPNRQSVRSIFAYTLAINSQYELAKQYSEPLQETEQVAALTTALIQLSENQKNEAIETLKQTVDMAPETFIAEKALLALSEQASEYIPSPLPEAIHEQLENSFSKLVPEFKVPSSRYSARLHFNGSDFLYGEDFPARLVIENTSSEPLVVCDKGLLTGNLRVDACLEGDLQVDIPNLYSQKFRPDKPILPGDYFSVPLDLNRGSLRKYLLMYPQANINVIFTVHLGKRDIQESGRGSDTSFVKGKIRRRGITLTGSFLMQRLDVLTKGQIGQKYQASSLFTGLFVEKMAVQNKLADFPHQQVEYQLLVDAVRKLLTDDDWKIRVHVMSSLSTMSVSLDPQMILNVSKNLNHENWPVRISAIYLLERIQSESFSKVLDWTAEHDPNSHVRQLAVALGAHQPEVQVEAVSETADTKQ